MKSRHMKAFVFVVFLLIVYWFVLGNQIEATENNSQPHTIYLNGSSGNDSRDGTTKSKAVRSIEKALELAGNQGKIIICGRVYINDGRTVDISNVSIERHPTFKNCLFELHGRTTINLSNVTIDGMNKVDVARWGHLFDLNYSSVLNIGENTHLINNQTNAIIMKDNSVVNMNGGSIKNNYAQISSFDESMYDGAAIFMEGGEVHLNGGVIENNTATSAGGAIAVFGGKITINGTEIKNNQADVGGAIYAGQNCEVIMKKGSIHHNQVKWDGAGIYTRGNRTTLFIEGGDIYENTIINASGYGSAVYLAESDITLKKRPHIKGEIYLENNNEVVNISADFEPQEPLEIGDMDGQIGRQLVYGQNMSTLIDKFFVTNRQNNLFLIQEGDYLQWTDEIPVLFYNEDHLFLKRLYVPKNQKLNLSKVPQPLKTGYTFMGWKTKDNQSWDMGNEVTGTVNLYPIWHLNRPEVSLYTSQNKAHIDESLLLEAQVNHEIENLNYQYIWYRDGKEIVGATQSTLSVSGNGKYHVDVIASDGNLQSQKVSSQVVPCVFTHMLDKQWLYDQTNHWQACYCGEKGNVSSHTYGSWKVVTQPQIGLNGIKIRECTLCHYQEEMAISALVKPKNDLSHSSSKNVTTEDTNHIFVLTVVGVISALMIAGLSYKKDHE